MLKSATYDLACLSAEEWTCAVYCYHMILYSYCMWNDKSTIFTGAIISKADPSGGAF